MALNDEPDDIPPDPTASRHQRRDLREWHVANLLVKARQRAGFTQGELAAALPHGNGVPPKLQSFVAKIEGRERSLGFSEGLDFCSVLNVDPRALHSESGELGLLEAQGKIVFEAAMPRHVRRGRPRKAAPTSAAATPEGRPGEGAPGGGSTYPSGRPRLRDAPVDDPGRVTAQEREADQAAESTRKPRRRSATRK